MNIPRENFDAATGTLNKGINLVEASAGTGKTFAIAMLVLRFVTEVGFPLPDILVVTFTRAATEELKERIRARLTSAWELLRGQETKDRSKTDPALESWRRGLAVQGISEELARQRLEMALLDMDLAPVFTIHGFCQRVLQEQALESGQLFDFELTTDLTSQRNQVIHDYWRRTVYPLSPQHCALITSDFKTPADLFKSVEDAGKRVARVEPQTGTVPETLTGFDKCVNSLAFWWQTHSTSLRALLEEGIGQDKFSKNFRDNFDDWWRQADEFLNGKTRQLPDNLEFLSPDEIANQLNGHKFRTSGGQSGEDKKQAFIATLPLPELELADLRQARHDITLALRGGLIHELASKLPQTLHRQNLLSYDDLITQLARNLVSPQGQELRRILGERYPVALIDEFQDTDNAQYSIFSSLFAGQGWPSVAGATDGTGATAGQGWPSVAGATDGTGATAGQGWPSVAGATDGTGATAGQGWPSVAGATDGTGATADASHYLYLIGDPKQAIYSFRGADIYSYFRARQQADIHLNLDRNYRSHPALVEAVNRLFSLREDSFAAADLPYHPVLPAKSAEERQLVKGDKNLEVMIFCELDSDPDSRDGKWSATRATERIVQYVVAETARILRQTNPVMLMAVEDSPRPLAASDIAILARNHKQADGFQTALAEAGIPSVMASQQSVFATTECHHLFQLMQALNAPGDTNLLKSAITSPWFGLNGQELYALWQDAEQVDLWLSRFHNYHQLWQERGFLTMMTNLLETEEILLNLARQPLAERKISNLHHLLELIQTAATQETMGPDKTLQWLRATRTAAKITQRGQEDTELRLESDREAVTIVTMHSAKGLEYPVVFCPFLWQRTSRLNTTNDLLTYHDEQKELVMDLGSPDFETHRQQALEEELAEELRLAYVALTRARCRCYTFWAEVKGYGRSGGSRDSALAWLLGLEQDGVFSERIVSLQTADGLVISELLAAQGTEPEIMMSRDRRAEELAPLVFTGHNLHTDWLLHSYSSLTAGWSNRPEMPELSIQPETPEAPDSPDSSSGSTTDYLPDLPKGAPLGNVLHALLETLSFSTLARGSDYEAAIQQQCSWFGVDVLPGKLAALLQKVARTPLLADADSAQFCLADLKQDETLTEMPFYLRLAPGSTDQINEILADRQTVTPVTSKTLQGYLTGFIDLICHYQGKYYVMDYKSNWLGNRLADYRPQQLEQAMIDHNYGLQYWLYTLILHRYLQTSMEDYDYTTHFGGIKYLFVRGMEPALPASGVYADLPDLATLERLDRCLGRSCAVHGTRDTGASLPGGRSCAVPGARDTGASLAGGRSSNGASEND